MVKSLRWSASCLVVFLLVSAAEAKAQEIVSANFSPSAICVGSKVTVTFDTTGIFPEGTLFTVDISDKNGSFNDFIFLQPFGPETKLEVIIPGDIEPGDNYRLRVNDNKLENRLIIKQRLKVSKATEPLPVQEATFCVNEEARPLSVDTEEGFTIKWYTNDARPLDAPPVPNTDKEGTESYKISNVTPEGCESGLSDYVVRIKNGAEMPETDGELTYCLGAEAEALKAEGAELKWYTSANSTEGSSDAPVPDTKKAGTKSYFVTQTINGCKSPKREIKVTVNNVATPPRITPAAVEYCEGVSADVLPQADGRQWFTSESGGDPLAADFRPPTDNEGTIRYYAGQAASGSCANTSRAAYTVTINPGIDAPNVASPETFCIGEPSRKLKAEGRNLLWYTAESGGEGSKTQPSVNTREAGNQTLYVTQSNAGCESPKASIQITVGAATRPVVSDPSAYCVGQEARPLEVQGENLRWYTAASGGSGSATVPTVNTSRPGNQSFFVSQTINGCESERVAIEVPVRAMPGAPRVTALGDVCQGTNVSAERLALAVQGQGLSWYSSETGGDKLPGTPTPNTGEDGIQQYFVSSTINGCEGPRSSVAFEVVASPAAPTAENVEYCQNAKAQALAASGDNLTWYTRESGGTGASTAPVPVTSKASSFAFFVTQKNQNSSLTCESPRTRVNVTVNPIPGLPRVADKVLCQTRGQENVSIEGSAGEGNSLVWYTSASGGEGSGNSPSVSASEAGESTFYVSQRSAQGCEGGRAALKVNVKALPAAPQTSTDLAYCQFASAKALTAQPASGGRINWYGTSANGGSASTKAPVPSTENDGTFNYYVSQTLNGCESDRAVIPIVVNSTPPPGVGSQFVFCQKEEAEPLSAEGTNLKWYRTRTTTEFQTTAFVPFTQSVGDFAFFVSQTGNNGCESPRAEIKIKVNPLPSATISGNSSISLGQSAEVSIRFSGEGPWAYELSSGEKGETDQNPLRIRVSPERTTTYLVTAISNRCGNGVPNGNAVVRVAVPTISTGSPDPASLCAGKVITVPFQASGSFIVGNKFSVQLSQSGREGDFISIPTKVNGEVATGTLPDTLEGRTYYVRVASVGNVTVPGNPSAVRLAVRPLSTAFISKSDTIQEGGSLKLEVILTGAAPWTFTYTDGTKESTITTSSSTFPFTVKPTKTTTYRVTRVQNDCGPGRITGAAIIQVDPVLGVEPIIVDWVKVMPTLIDAKILVQLQEDLSKGGSTYQVLDALGRKIKEGKIVKKNTSLDASRLPAGLYLIKVANGEKRATLKVLKK